MSGYSKNTREKVVLILNVLLKGDAGEIRKLVEKAVPVLRGKKSL